MTKSQYWCPIALSEYKTSGLDVLRNTTGMIPEHRARSPECFGCGPKPSLLPQENIGHLHQWSDYRTILSLFLIRHPCNVTMSYLFIYLFTFILGSPSVMLKDLLPHLQSGITPSSVPHGDHMGCGGRSLRWLHASKCPTPWTIDPAHGRRLVRDVGFHDYSCNILT